MTVSERLQLLVGDLPQRRCSSARRGDQPAIDYSAFTYYRQLERVGRFLAEHYAESITRSAAANVAGLEDHYFSTFFHEKTGVRFKTFVTMMRLNQAMNQMTMRDSSISWIAQSVGYQTLEGFERAFKRAVGLTPREYRCLSRPH